MPQEGTRISVAMTTFQGERHVREQLESILHQSRTPDEIVVSDDASTDNTWRIVTQLAKRSGVPIRLHRQERNVGLRINVEAAIGATSGTVIVLADQDDIWEEDKVETLAAAFDDADVMLWFSDAALIDDTGVLTGRTAWEAIHFPTEERERVVAGTGLRRLLYGMTVTGSTMAFRRDLTTLALPLPTALDGSDHLYLHDGWLAVLADLRGRIVVEDSPLTRYRQHAGQFTAMSMTQPTTSGQGAPDTSTSGLRRDRERQLQLDRDRVHLVAQRLREAHAIGLCRASAVQELLALEDFLTVRTLPPRTRGRRARVVHQVLRGRYSRFARGMRTAVADIL